MDGEKGGKGVWRWGKREIIYLSLHCHHQNDSCIKMGSDESHINIPVGSDGQSKRKDLGSIPLRLSFLFKRVVVCGHCLVTLSITSC